jgi:hypothetical protein
MPGACTRNSGLALAAASLCFYYATTRIVGDPPELAAQRRLLAELDAEASRTSADHWGLPKPDAQQQQEQQGRERR